MRVMACVTTFPEHPHIHAVCWGSMLRMSWAEPFELVVCMDKGARPTNQDEKIQNQGEKFQRAVELFLASGCDALLSLEADNLIPPDALAKLASVDADIVYGLYCSRPNKDHVWMLRRGMKIGMGGVLRERKEMMAVWNQVVPSDGVGLGCTLIHRRAFDAIKPTWSPGLDAAWHLAKQAKAAGLRQVHDCRVHVGHLVSERAAVWPDPKTTFKIKEI